MPIPKKRTAEQEKRLPDTGKRFISISEFGRRNGVSYATIKSAMRSGELKTITTNSGGKLIDTQPDSVSNTEIAQRLGKIETQVGMLLSVFNLRQNDGGNT